MGFCEMERAAGIEPAHQPWQGRRLPLHHARIIITIYQLTKTLNFLHTNKYH